LNPPSRNGRGAVLSAERVRPSPPQAGRAMRLLWAVLVAGVAATAHAQQASAVRVIDGETLRYGRERIRILGIDAPETENRARCDAERQLAAKATMTLTDIISGKRLEIERHGKDRFGRTLADVGEMLIMANVAVRWGNGVEQALERVTSDRRPDWCAKLAR
jgi:endonuclease YncB( thermonuclease family)